MNYLREGLGFLSLIVDTMVVSILSCLEVACTPVVIMASVSRDLS